MSNLYLPQRAFFDFAFHCPQRAEPPKIDGNLKDWDDDALVPDLMAVDGHQPFASAYMAWDDSGLYFAIEVKNKTTYKLNPRTPTEGDCLELFIDTRDVKEHRANRFCHRFYFLPGGRFFAGFGSRSMRRSATRATWGGAAPGAAPCVPRTHQDNTPHSPSKRPGARRHSRVPPSSTRGARAQLKRSHLTGGAARELP